MRSSPCLRGPPHGPWGPLHGASEVEPYPHRKRLPRGAASKQTWRRPPSCRFLSVCPPVYWFAAQLKGRWRWWAWMYFLGYVLVGSITFGNSYNWT